MSVIFVDIAALMWIALCIYTFYVIRKTNKKMDALLKEIKDEVSE